MVCGSAVEDAVLAAMNAQGSLAPRVSHCLAFAVPHTLLQVKGSELSCINQKDTVGFCITSHTPAGRAFPPAGSSCTPAGIVLPHTLLQEKGSELSCINPKDTVGFCITSHTPAGRAFTPAGSSCTPAGSVLPHTLLQVKGSELSCINPKDTVGFCITSHTPAGSETKFWSCHVGCHVR